MDKYTHKIKNSLYKAKNALKRLYDKIYIKSHYPHELTVYIAPPGSGKTSHAARLAQKAMLHNLQVYSNVPIKGTKVLDVKSMLGKVDVSDALIIIDEAGLQYDNRNFAKNFLKEEIEFFKLHRHYRTAIMVYSQSVDVDKKLRDLARTVRIVRKTPIKGLIFTKTVAKYVDVDKETRQLIDCYELKLAQCSFHWVRPAWKLFDSWDAPQLPHIEVPTW